MIYNQIVEYLRQKMISLVEEKGSFTHPDVVAISQRLDQYIVQIQRQKAMSQATVNRRQLRHIQFSTLHKYQVGHPFRLLNV